MIVSVEPTMLNGKVLFCIEDHLGTIVLLTIYELRRGLANKLYGPPIEFCRAQISEEERKKNKYLEKIIGVQYKLSRLMRRANKQITLLMKSNKSLEKQIRWLDKIIEIEQMSKSYSRNTKCKYNIEREIEKTYLKYFDKTKYERIPLFKATMELMKLHKYGALTALREANMGGIYIPDESFDQIENNLLQGFYNYRNKINSLNS